MPLRRIVISGCSGGGKSTLIEALASRGFHTCAEAGRIIIRQELETDGQALPWIDPRVFAERLAILAINQFNASAELDKLTFFDRCVVESLVYSQMLGVRLSPSVRQAAMECHYDDPIFIVPPWQEIFANDHERRHNLIDAVAEYEALSQTFVEFGYKVCVIPRMAVEDRIGFIFDELGIAETFKPPPTA